jgi:hypothetical protein
MSYLAPFLQPLYRYEVPLQSCATTLLKPRPRTIVRPPAQVSALAEGSGKTSDDGEDPRSGRAGW